MSISRTVTEVLQEHVTLEVEGIDRMYLNVYVPALQRAGGVANFFRFHRGHQFASSALMDPISKAFIARYSTTGRFAVPDRLGGRCGRLRRDNCEGAFDKSKHGDSLAKALW